MPITSDLRVMCHITGITSQGTVDRIFTIIKAKLFVC